MKRTNYIQIWSLSFYGCIIPLHLSCKVYQVHLAMGGNQPQRDFSGDRCCRW
jgi:hypothetical protein